MRHFNDRTVYLLKEIYVTLGTKHIRQVFLRDIIWALKPFSHSKREMFLLYCNLVKSFYN